jgi:hypothetical protein
MGQKIGLWQPYRDERIEAAEIKLLRPLAGYTLYDHKTNDSVRRELQTECILDKTDEYRPNWLLQLQRMPQDRIPMKWYHYRPQGRRTIGRPKNVGESRCNCGDGRDQGVQSLMFMTMMIMTMMIMMMMTYIWHMYYYTNCTIYVGTWNPKIG